MLSSRSCIVLHFTFRSLAHFELIFVKGIRSVSTFIFFFHVDIPFFLPPFLLSPFPLLTSSSGLFLLLSLFLLYWEHFKSCQPQKSSPQNVEKKENRFIFWKSIKSDYSVLLHRKSDKNRKKEILFFLYSQAVKIY